MPQRKRNRNNHLELDVREVVREQENNAHIKRRLRLLRFEQALEAI